MNWMKSLSLNKTLAAGHRRPGTRGGSQALDRAPAARAGPWSRGNPGAGRQGRLCRFPGRAARSRAVSVLTAALDVDVATDVTPEERLRTTPPQQRAQHVSPRDFDARVVCSVRPPAPSCRPTAAARRAHRWSSRDARRRGAQPRCVPCGNRRFLDAVLAAAVVRRSSMGRNPDAGSLPEARSHGLPRDRPLIHAPGEARSAGRTRVLEEGTSWLLICQATHRR